MLSAESKKKHIFPRHYPGSGLFCFNQSVASHVYIVCTVCYVYIYIIYIYTHTVMYSSVQLYTATVYTLNTCRHVCVRVGLITF